MMLYHHNAQNPAAPDASSKPSVLRWVLAIAMVCLLLALPLHQARHASEPVSAAAPPARWTRPAV